MSPCSEFVSASRADAVVRAPDADTSVTLFGGELREMFDIDGDVVGEVQISARTVNAQGESSVRVYIFSPSRAEVLVQFDPIFAQPEFPEVRGDVDANAEVTDADLGVVLDNFALQAPTRQAGDLDGDGNVGLADLTEVMTEFGCRGYRAIAAPLGSVETVRCDLGTAGVALVTPRASEIMRLVIVERAGFEEFEIGFVPLPNHYPPGFGFRGNLPLLMGCASDPRVQFALRRIWIDCPLEPYITVNARECLPLESFPAPAVTIPNCVVHGRKIQIEVCTNAEDPCGLLAHELLHAAQFCALGFFESSTSCETLFGRVSDRYGYLCRELEANRFSGLCSGEPLVSHAECCERICFAYALALGWRGEGCSINCVDCCSQFANPIDSSPLPHCCHQGEWICDDICKSFSSSSP